ncbi:Adenylate kinase [Paenibacillaceae bacterium GAS479]|nr:Adenylate kinase [Paenibacillaceae bacterium GAS479]
MNKILIIGIVASGKTTLAKRLSIQLNIPWYELDCIVHHRTSEESYKRTADEQVEVIMEIDEHGPWIFEGTDRESYSCLFEMADTIIFLDPPLWKRKIRIFTRYLKQNLGIEKCHYKSDLKMLRMMYKWTRNFELKREQFESKLQPHKHKLIRLANSSGFIGSKTMRRIQQKVL